MTKFNIVGYYLFVSTKYFLLENYENKGVNEKSNERKRKVFVNDILEQMFPKLFENDCRTASFVTEKRNRDNVTRREKRNGNGNGNDSDNDKSVNLTVNKSNDTNISITNVPKQKKQKNKPEVKIETNDDKVTINKNKTNVNNVLPKDFNLHSNVYFKDFITNNTFDTEKFFEYLSNVKPLFYPPVLIGFQYTDMKKLENIFSVNFNFRDPKMKSVYDDTKQKLLANINEYNNNFIFKTTNGKELSQKNKSKRLQLFQKPITEIQDEKFVLNLFRYSITDINNIILTNRNKEYDEINPLYKKKLELIRNARLEVQNAKLIKIPQNVAKFKSLAVFVQKTFEVINNEPAVYNKHNFPETVEKYLPYLAKIQEFHNKNVFGASITFEENETWTELWYSVYSMYIQTLEIAFTDLHSYVYSLDLREIIEQKYTLKVFDFYSIVITRLSKSFLENDPLGQVQELLTLNYPEIALIPLVMFVKNKNNLTTDEDTQVNNHFENLQQKYVTIINDLNNVNYIEDDYMSIDIILYNTFLTHYKSITKFIFMSTFFAILNNNTPLNQKYKNFIKGFGNMITDATKISWMQKMMEIEIIPQFQYYK